MFPSFRISLRVINMCTDVSEECVPCSFRIWNKPSKKPAWTRSNQLLYWAWQEYLTPYLGLYTCLATYLKKEIDPVSYTFMRFLVFRIADVGHSPELPLWSSVQSSWPQIQRSRLRFPVLPDFLSSSVSGTGSTQPRGDNWEATWMKLRAAARKIDINGRGDQLRWSRDTHLPAKVGNNFADERRLLGQYVSLADWKPRRLFLFGQSSEPL
jgi:hypothetical protein